MDVTLVLCYEFPGDFPIETWFDVLCSLDLHHVEFGRHRKDAADPANYLEVLCDSPWQWPTRIQ